MFWDLRKGDGLIEAEELVQKGFRSVCLAKWVLEDLEAALPSSAKSFLKESCMIQSPIIFRNFTFWWKSIIKIKILQNCYHWIFQKWGCSLIYQK